MGEQAAASAFGGVAQLGEHLPCKQGVMSSNLTISTLAMRHTKPKPVTKKNDLTTHDQMMRTKG